MTEFCIRFVSRNFNKFFWQLIVVKDDDYLKTNKDNLFVSSTLNVFSYNSPNFFNTHRYCFYVFLFYKTKRSIFRSPDEPAETAELKEQRLIHEFIAITPKKFYKISPGNRTDFQIRFNPSERMKTFTEKVLILILPPCQTFCFFFFDYRSIIRYRTTSNRFVFCELRASGPITP